MTNTWTEKNDRITAPTSNWRRRGHRKANLLPASQTLIFFGFANKHLYL